MLALLTVANNEFTINSAIEEKPPINEKEKDIKPFINYIETSLKEEEKKK